MKKPSEMTDQELCRLIENRWGSSESVWKIVEKAYSSNTKHYDSEIDDKDRAPGYILNIPVKKLKIRANRIFRDMESVINSLIANPPKPNIVPGRPTPESQELAQLQTGYFARKYEELNVKETIRKGLRNLYFGRLVVLKPFWNPKTNDFDVIAVDPRKVRFAKKATKEVESEFAIEEVEDSLESVIARFPAKEADILQKAGVAKDDVAILNPTITYKEAHIKDHVIFKYEDIILGKIRNPYWDWDGLLVTPQEDEALRDLSGTQRKEKLAEIRNLQTERRQTQQPPAAEGEAPAPAPAPAEGEGEIAATPNQTEAQSLMAYRFNHFDVPRKPYIFATIFNNENTPVGRTDMISQAATLQEGIDRRKRQIDENAEMMNGIVKVDASVMDKSDAQKLRFEATGIIWGKGVKDGVTRETGAALPEFILKDMQDSRDEIDNIMAASSAFRGEREGTETKAGRLALIQQSFLNLNELVQVVDYLSSELFNWFYQLSKVNYTETHYAKTLGENDAVKIIELQQDDFEDGAEIRVIPGKTLPEDQEFKYERAQKDAEAGRISPIDYLRDAGYSNPVETAKNAEIFKLNPIKASGITDEELAELVPQDQNRPEEPSQSISYKDLPPDGQMQLAAKAGIQLDPQTLAGQHEHQQKIEAEHHEAKLQSLNRPSAPRKSGPG
jgi:hypothetical protein